MPVEYKSRVAHLVDEVTVEDAEPLFEWLETTAAASINLKRCSHLHAAVLQALMQQRPRITATPTDASLLQWLIAADLINKGARDV